MDKKLVVICSLVGVVVVLGGALVYSVFFGGNLFSFGGSDSVSLTLDVEDVPSYVGPADSRLPSSLVISVSPSPCDMGDRVLGQLTSDGFNFGIATSVVHVGNGASNTVPGFVDSDGQWLYSDNLNIPGVWRFQTMAENGVTSNVVSLSVRGVLVDLENSLYSKTLGMPVKINVFTHHVNQAVTVFLDTGYSSDPLGTVTVNSGGYASLSVTLDSYANGDYEIDAVVSGDQASSWGATDWVTVGR